MAPTSKVDAIIANQAAAAVKAGTDARDNHIQRLIEAEQNADHDRWIKQACETRDRENAEASREAAKHAANRAAEQAEAVARHAERMQAIADDAAKGADAIAADIAALINNPTRLDARGRSVAVDVGQLRQEIDLIARWIAATAGQR